MTLVNVRTIIEEMERARVLGSPLRTLNVIHAWVG